MTRKYFLQNNWKSYPVWKHQEGPWLRGRLEFIDSEMRVTVSGHPEKIRLQMAPETLYSHSDFGNPIPIACVRLGDVIAISPDGIPYLLAPNLQGEMSGTVRVDGPIGATDSVVIAKQWQAFLERIREALRAQGLTEIRTPSLVVSPGVDHHIDFLTVKGSASGRQWTLPTSPEIHLKKALCLGFDHIFEIKNCFRDDWISPQHQVEFYMLEWYRTYSTFQDLEADLVALFEALRPLFPKMPSTKISSVTVASLFQAYLSFSLEPETTYEELLELAKSKGLNVAKDDSWNDLFFRLFLECIEPNLGDQGLVQVTHWPKSQASLARIEEGWAQRFELYGSGMELANAYVEENDPDANRQVFQQEDLLRGNDEKLKAPLDSQYLTDLERGMPPATGIALGLDRLFCLCTGLDGISAGRLFPESADPTRIDE